MTAKEVLDFVKKNKAVMVDLKFVDFPGTWEHFTIPIEELTDTVFTEGSGFDGSSIRGWQAIQNSDMMVVPDPETAVMDPFTTVPTLSMICNIVDPITRQNYSRDPRNVAQKAEKYLKQTDRKSTRLNSSHLVISYAVFCLKKKNNAGRKMTSLD